MLPIAANMEPMSRTRSRWTAKGSFTGLLAADAPGTTAVEAGAALAASKAGPPVSRAASFFTMSTKEGDPGNPAVPVGGGVRAPAAAGGRKGDRVGDWADMAFGLWAPQRWHPCRPAKLPANRQVGQNQSLPQPLPLPALSTDCIKTTTLASYNSKTTNYCACNATTGDIPGAAHATQKTSLSKAAWAKRA